MQKLQSKRIIMKCIKLQIESNNKCQIWIAHITIFWHISETMHFIHRIDLLLEYTLKERLQTESSHFYKQHFLFCYLKVRKRVKIKFKGWIINEVIRYHHFFLKVIRFILVFAYVIILFNFTSIKYQSAKISIKKRTIIFLNEQK